MTTMISKTKNEAYKNCTMNPVWGKRMLKTKENVTRNKIKTHPAQKASLAKSFGDDFNLTNMTEKSNIMAPKVSPNKLPIIL